MCACVHVSKLVHSLRYSCKPVCSTFKKGVGKKIRVKNWRVNAAIPRGFSHMHNMQHVALHANTCPMANVRGHRVLNVICQSLVGQMGSKMNPRVRVRPQSGHPTPTIIMQTLSARTCTRRKRQDVRSVQLTRATRESSRSSTCVRCEICFISSKSSVRWWLLRWWVRVESDGEQGVLSEGRIHALALTSLLALSSPCLLPPYMSRCARMFSRPCAIGGQGLTVRCG
jgi:hypothetical protein